MIRRGAISKQRESDGKYDSATLHTHTHTTFSGCTSLTERKLMWVRNKIGMCAALHFSICDLRKRGFVSFENNFVLLTSALRSCCVCIPKSFYSMLFLAFFVIISTRIALFFRVLSGFWHRIFGRIFGSIYCSSLISSNINSRISFISTYHDTTCYNFSFKINRNWLCMSARGKSGLHTLLSTHHHQSYPSFGKFSFDKLIPSLLSFIRPMELLVLTDLPAWKAIMYPYDSWYSSEILHHIYIHGDENSRKTTTTTTTYNVKWNISTFMAPDRMLYAIPLNYFSPKMMGRRVRSEAPAYARVCTWKMELENRKKERK